MATSAEGSDDATAGTISAPLDLSIFQTAKGDHEAVSVNGAGSSRQGRITPMPKVTLTSLTKNNSGTLRKLNSVVLPIVYSEKFYKDVLDDVLEDVNKFIYYGDIPVGAICCRFDDMTSTSQTKPPTLVILTLAILAPYRHQRLGTALLTRTLQNAAAPVPPPKALPSLEKPDKPVKGNVTVAAPRRSVKRAIAHVQLGNDTAKRFYERFGFKESELVKDFYSKLEPRAAYLMVCDDIDAGLSNWRAASA